MSSLFETIVLRLRDTCPSLGQVEAAAVAAQAETMTLGPVATVLVVPAAERWDRVKDAGMRVSTGGVLAFSCVWAVTAPAGTAEWETSRREIRASLLGWSPPWEETSGPVEAAGGRLLAFSAAADGRWIHAFDFNLPISATYEHQS